MQLTNEQLEAVRSGESVRLNEGGTDLVVLRADVFERRVMNGRLKRL